MQSGLVCAAAGGRPWVAPDGVREIHSKSHSCPTSGSQPVSPVIKRGWDTLSPLAKCGRFLMSQTRTRKIFLLHYYLSPLPGPQDPVSIKQPTRLGCYDFGCGLRIRACKFSYKVFTLPSFPQPHSEHLSHLCQSRIHMYTVWCGTSTCQPE